MPRTIKVLMRVSRELIAEYELPEDDMTDEQALECVKEIQDELEEAYDRGEPCYGKGFNWEEIESKTEYEIYKEES